MRRPHIKSDEYPQLHQVQNDHSGDLANRAFRL